VDFLERKQEMNILGTEYSFEHNSPLLKELCADGICQQYNRRIAVREVVDMLEDADSMEVKEMRYQEVCRHEVIHGFFGEAGLEQYNNDETLVVFLAVNFPKMAKIFAENGWLE
jgi:hypothetical protein